MTDDKEMHLLKDSIKQYGVLNPLIVRPVPDGVTENRLFFVDEGFENNEPMDEMEKFYLYKSIARLKLNQNAQNPITYLNL